MSVDYFIANHKNKTLFSFDRHGYDMYMEILHEDHWKQDKEFLEMAVEDSFLHYACECYPDLVDPFLDMLVEKIWRFFDGAETTQLMPLSDSDNEWDDIRWNAGFGVFADKSKEAHLPHYKVIDSVFTSEEELKRFAADKSLPPLQKDQLWEEYHIGGRRPPKFPYTPV